MIRNHGNTFLFHSTIIASQSLRVIFRMLFRLKESFTADNVFPFTRNKQHFPVRYIFRMIPTQRFIIYRQFVGEKIHTMTGSPCVTATIFLPGCFFPNLFDKSQDSSCQFIDCFSFYRICRRCEDRIIERMNIRKKDCP